MVDSGRAAKPNARHLPDFIAVGPPRTGTTWLHGVLYHRVSLPEGVKETHFFDFHYAKGIQWYLHYFRNSADGYPIGEITPSYFGSAEARERIRAELPDCRIICTLRDPVARAWSHFRKLQFHGSSGATFEDEVRNNPEIHETGRYAFHLRAWRESFGESNVGVFFYDDLEADPQSFVDAICRFVGVEPVELTSEVTKFLDRNEVPRAPRNRSIAKAADDLMNWLQSRHAHRWIGVLGRIGVWRLCAANGEQFASLSPEVEARVREYFMPEVEALEQLVGRDLSAWKPAHQDHTPAASSR